MLRTSSAENGSFAFVFTIGGLVAVAGGLYVTFKVFGASPDSIADQLHAYGETGDSRLLLWTRRGGWQHLLVGLVAIIVAGGLRNHDRWAKKVGLAVTALYSFWAVASIAWVWSSARTDNVVAPTTLVLGTTAIMVSLVGLSLFRAEIDAIPVSGPPELGRRVAAGTSAGEHASASDRASVVVRTFNGARRTFELPVPIAVGRSVDDNDIVLRDPAVGRQHLIIRAHEGGYEVESLPSLTGTWLLSSTGNPVRIDARTAIPNGSRLRIGTTTLEVRRTAPEAS